MGKRLITQRRGKGSLTYRSPSHKFNYPTSYPKSDEKLIGNVHQIIKDPGRTSPTALIKFNNKNNNITNSKQTY